MLAIPIVIVRVPMLAIVTFLLASCTGFATKDFLLNPTKYPADKDANNVLIALTLIQILETCIVMISYRLRHLP